MAHHSSNVHSDARNAALEIVDLVDDANRVIGCARRRAVRLRNLLHRGVGILCRNSAGEIHVHRRTMTKDVFPGLYDMLVGGVVGHGESFVDAARREIREELGIAGVELRRQCRYRYEGDRNRSIVEVFEVTWDGRMELQEEEIAWGAFLSPEEIEQRIGDWEFVPDGLEIYRHLQRLQRM